MKKEALIFDIDGTLWDASLSTVWGWNNGLKKLGIEKEIDIKQLKSLIGHPDKEIIDVLLPGIRDRYSQLLKVLRDSEMDAIRERGGFFYEGVVEGIKKLSGFYKIFIVSNCQDWYLRMFLDRSGLEPVIAGFDCYGISKLSKHEMLAKIKNRFSLKEAVYVGDAALDQKSACLARMDFVHVSYGFGALEDKARTFDSFKDLTNYFINAVRRLS